MVSTMICKSSVVTSRTLCQVAEELGIPIDLIIIVYKSTSPLIHHRMKLYLGNFGYEILIFGLNYSNFHFVTSYFVNDSLFNSQSQLATIGKTEILINKIKWLQLLGKWKYK